MKSIILLALFLSIILSIPAASSSQTTWYVPDDFPTIQGAISSSSVVNGDTVIVRSGTYVENIDFIGKAINLTSEEGPEKTTIDGNQVLSVVTFQNGEGSNTVLDGFTITNGFAFDGGGIYCHSSSPIIVNNTITVNLSDTDGGGIYCCLSSPTIKNNTITGNLANLSGGGITCTANCSPIIENNIITGNSTIHDGGGIWSDGSPTIENNFITGNSAIFGRGGGIGCNLYSPTIKNNTLAGNSADDYGGGIYCAGSSATIKHNTISENSADYGGGIYCYYSSLTIDNTILWDNYASAGPEIWMGNKDYPSTLSINYSDVKGGQASVYVDPGCTLNWGAGMIDADPLFVVGPNGLYYLSQTMAGQSMDSPCVDTGSDLASNLGMDTLWTRTDSVPDSGVVDMGFHYGPFSAGWTVPLYSDTYVIPETTGGIANFTFTAGEDNANRNYILLGGVTGTDPGTPLPGGMVTLPINWDFFTDFVVSLINTPIFTDFLATLDTSGTATAQLNAPPVPGFAGVTMHYAYALNNPWDFVSNPVAIEIVP